MEYATRKEQPVHYRPGHRHAPALAGRHGAGAGNTVIRNYGNYHHRCHRLPALAGGGAKKSKMSRKLYARLGERKAKPAQPDGPVDYTTMSLDQLKACRASLEMWETTITYPGALEDIKARLAVVNAMIKKREQAES